jgi:hypothetical protein
MERIWITWHSLIRELQRSPDKAAYACVDQKKSGDDVAECGPGLEGWH